MKMILFVLHDATKLFDVLDAWEQAGAGGATVLFSTGMGRLRQDGGLRDDLPLIPSLGDFYQPSEKLSRTLFSVVEDDTTVERVRQATSKVVGDLGHANTGLLVVLPVEQADGVRKIHK
jgi:nitrogen regulatory protein PII